MNSELTIKAFLIFILDLRPIAARGYGGRQTTRRLLRDHQEGNILDLGLAKSLGEKGVTEIAPLFVSHDRDLGDVFVVVDQEAEYRPNRPLSSSP